MSLIENLKMDWLCHVYCCVVMLKQRTHFTVLFILAQLTAANPSIQSTPPDPLMSTWRRTHRYRALFIEWAGPAVCQPITGLLMRLLSKWRCSFRDVQMKEWTNDCLSVCVCVCLLKIFFCGEVKTKNKNPQTESLQDSNQTGTWKKTTNSG